MMRLPEAARFLGIGRKKLRGLCNAKKIKCLRDTPRGPRLFDERWLEEYKEHYAQGGPKIPKSKEPKGRGPMPIKQVINEKESGRSV
jgi:hypothetical protein